MAQPSQFPFAHVYHRLRGWSQMPGQTTALSHAWFDRLTAWWPWATATTDTSDDVRRIEVNDPTARHWYRDNRIKNTKYTLWTFLPLSLREQFREIILASNPNSRFINFYFLLIALLQLVPALTPVNPVTTWGPLGLIFTISATKEALDDLRRARSDKEFNEASYITFRDGQPTAIRSQDIRPGDLLELCPDDEIPCDVALLKTSENQGTCHVQTSNLDGETDLKTKEAPGITQALPLDLLAFLKARAECPLPNDQLYYFDARLHLPEQDTVVPLTSCQLLHQGTVVRNTHRVWGVAVYTGMDTKIGQNKQAAPVKFTRVDAQIERSCVAVFVFQLALTIGIGVYGNHFQESTMSQHVYLYPAAWLASFNHAIIPLRMLLLLSFMIPISLKISMDIAKGMFALFIGWDLAFYNEEHGEGARVANTAISEDLGQVEYVITDKTGTLTLNQMTFKGCSVGTAWYGLPPASAGPYPCHALDTLAHDSNFSAAATLLRAVALCNTVTPCAEDLTTKDLNSVLFAIDDAVGEAPDSAATSSPPNQRHQYSGTSPDEVALVQGVASHGVILCTRAESYTTLSVLGTTERWEVLHTFEFTSDRKRMSVLVRCVDAADSSHTTDTHAYYLITKGADDVMFPRCQPHSSHHASTQAFIAAAAEQGLRTLALGVRSLTHDEYATWYHALKQAQVSLDQRTQLVHACYAQLESSLILVGATAVEDKLQTNVPETIQALQMAGIKTWMATGDKVATAIQIGQSCRLLYQPAERLTRIQLTAAEAPSGLEAELLVDRLWQTYRPTDADPESWGGCCMWVTPAAAKVGPKLHNVARLEVVVEGVFLELLLKDKESPVFPTSLLQLLLAADAVVFARVTPRQKSLIVAQVKRQNHVALAIGDGGNDVLMIQQANVGVGMRGREGLEAARAADYSIVEFSHLRRLLLVHGRYSLHRTAFIAVYCFYKSIYLCTVQVLYQTMAGYSGATLLSTFSLSTYNALFTSLPVLSFILDRDVETDVLLAHPALYASNAGRSYAPPPTPDSYLAQLLPVAMPSVTSNNWLAPAFWFTCLVNGFVRWTLRAVYQALMTLLLAAVLATNWQSAAQTQEECLQVLQALVFTVVILVAQGTLALYMNSFTWVNYVALFGTMVAYFVFSYGFSIPAPFGMYHLMHTLYRDPAYWAAAVILSMLCLLPFTIWRYYVVNYRPKPFEALQRATTRGQ
ncbi:hypothetical protein H4R34_000336 [Dimargaris verticillata]|uniref:Phospholipid-transporting ATPase n=1 Tax=Dimargaris verticillata TaxID=2761393 RepID=A0A9W8EEU3_9FUNG|nr:hypothetical protein H4R34_000336 [Dimargaris verticillata]